ncbi:MAG: thiosulfohydrolase SoxB, partial [Hyphomicrobiaceae bacterium]
VALAAATGAVTGFGVNFAARAAQQKISQDDLLLFPSKGQVTLLHSTDWHAQLLPVHFREPSINIGVGDVAGKPPHLTGDALLQHFNIKPDSLEAHVLTDRSFVALAREYGKIGGVDRIATLVNAIRAERGDDKVLYLDGGDTLQGSYTSLKSGGGDMISVLNQLKADATTGHWEFTYGAERVVEAFGTKDEAGEFKGDFLAGNVFDTEWEEPVFKSTKIFEKNGVKIAVVGQAFPYTPIANPRWKIPAWSFGVRDETVQQNVDAAREAGAEVVVCLSHNGFDVDRKLASRVRGIDVILVGHTHDIVPEAVKVGDTLLISTGSHGKCISRLDIEVKSGRMVDYSYRLIPVLADAIAPDPDMQSLVSMIRAPHESMLKTELATADSLLYRRGNFNGTFDDVICEAMLEARDAEVCFSPGVRWGASILPGQAITWDDVYNMTAITYPNCYRIKMTGEQIKLVLEDVCDNLFNPDPYFQQGGDMVRVGGLAYTCRVDRKIGERIADLTFRKSGDPIDPKREYVVAGWASVNEGTEGPPIWDVVGDYLKRKKTIQVDPNNSIKVVRG